MTESNRGPLLHYNYIKTIFIHHQDRQTNLTIKLTNKQVSRVEYMTENINIIILVKNTGMQGVP